MKYNTNDLMLGRYIYYYSINDINIIGERMGVLYLNNGVYSDLITSDEVVLENIISKKSFNARDNEVSLDSIRRIFEGIEDVCEYMATERQEGNIDDSIPSIITFRASEMNHALESMVKVSVKESSKLKKISRFRRK